MTIKKATKMTGKFHNTVTKSDNAALTACKAGGFHDILMKAVKATSAASMVGILTMISVLTSCTSREILFDGSSEYVTYSCPAPFEGKTVDIFYNIPEGLSGKAPVQIVMHGDGRNGESYFKAWKGFSDERKFVLIVPQFTKEQFSVMEYHQGNVMAADSTFNAKEDRIYEVLDEIFRYFIDHSRIRADKFNIYGHSAGGQFVHRFMMLGNTEHVGKAIAANPGWYTFPADSAAWPYGTGVPTDSKMDQSSGREIAADQETQDGGDDAGSSPGILSENEKKAFYAKDMTILIGKADTLRYNNNLHISPEADAQGLNRYERAHSFYNWCKRDAASMGTEFNWNILEVPEVGHSNTKMAPAAVELLYPTL